MFWVTVTDDGRGINVRVKWPSPLTDTDMLQRALVRDPEIDNATLFGEASGFRKALRDEREHLHQDVFSDSVIPLPFQCLPVFEFKKNLGWNDNDMRAVYVRLASLADGYSDVGDNEDFVSA